MNPKLGNYLERFSFYTSGSTEIKHTPQYSSFTHVLALYHWCLDNPSGNVTLPTHLLQVLHGIREIAGYGKCWGYAKEILSMLNNYPNVYNRSKLIELHESLLIRMLEVLPAYNSWMPTAYISGNQGLIVYLNTRCNKYRISGNPKFYAYDTVLQNLATTRVLITRDNYKYIKGVGPKMSKHISEYLSHAGAERVHEWPVVPVASIVAPQNIQRDSINTYYINTLYALLSGTHKKFAEEIKNSPGVPMIKGDFMKYSTFTPDVFNIIFKTCSTDSHCPIAKNWVNIRLVEWLWEECEYASAKAAAVKPTPVSDPQMIRCRKDLARRIREEVYGTIMPEYFNNLGEVRVSGVKRKAATAF